MIQTAFLEEIIIALVNIFGFFLSFWVLRADKKNRLNQWFFAMTFFVIFWVDFALLGSIVKNQAFSIIFYKLNWVMVALFLISSFYFYVIHFLRIQFVILRKIILTVGILLVGFCLFTPFIIQDVVIQPWGNEIVFGSLNSLFNLYSVVVALLVVVFLIKRYFSFSAIERLKTQYLLIGTFLFFLANIVFNVIVPSVTTTVAYQHFGDYSAIFLLGFTALAIVKQNLFGIKVVLTQIFVVLIALLLLVDSLTSQTAFEYFWKGAIFGLFVLFGWLLIKSVVHEIRQKEELDKLATRVSVANIQLEGAYDKLKVLDEAKSEFISIASHQLRTPLTAIKGYISMLLEGDYGKVTPKIRKPIANVYESCERLITLVNSLLNLSRLETGKLSLEVEQVNIGNVSDDVVGELSGKATERGLYLKVERVTNPESLVIRADQEKLRHIILNLIDNAIKYTAKGGVTVFLERKATKLRIKVKDTGEGLVPEEISKLFESFSRGGAGKKMWVDGTGLGLYIAKKFVEMHQGEVWVESEGKGKGSSFIAEIPLDL